MLKRKIDHELFNWKYQTGHKSLIITGPAQCGKTSAVKSFAGMNYDETIEIDFKKKPSLSGIFSGDFDIDTLLAAMRFRFPGKKFMPGKTLIFIDSAGSCPRVLSALRAFTEDKRYDCIAAVTDTGKDLYTMQRLMKKDDTAAGMDISSADVLPMQMIDFGEFLWACGISESLTDSLRWRASQGLSVDKSLHDALMGYFNAYICTGGLPEAAGKYAATLSLRETDRIQKKALSSLLLDISSTGKKTDREKAPACFKTLPAQLIGKENHRFMYKVLGAGARAQKYRPGIDMLTSYGYCFSVHEASHIGSGMMHGLRDGVFRLCPQDISFFSAMEGMGLKQRITEDMLTPAEKQGLYEYAAADMLHKSGYLLSYYRDDEKKQKVSLIAEKDGKAVLFDVRTAGSRAKTPDAWIASAADDMSDIGNIYILSDSCEGFKTPGEKKEREEEDCGSRPDVIRMPVYMAAFL